MLPIEGFLLYRLSKEINLTCNFMAPFNANNLYERNEIGDRRSIYELVCAGCILYTEVFVSADLKPPSCTYVHVNRYGAAIKALFR